MATMREWLDHYFGGVLSKDAYYFIASSLVCTPIASKEHNNDETDFDLVLSRGWFRRAMQLHLYMSDHDIKYRDYILSEGCDELNPEYQRWFDSFVDRHRSTFEKYINPIQGDSVDWVGIKRCMTLPNPEYDTLFIESFKKFLTTNRSVVRKKQKALSFEDLVDFVMSYGEDEYGVKCEQPAENFEQLSTFYSELRKNILARVFGQDAAVEKFIQGLFTGRTSKKSSVEGPEATFLFVGPPGVGKTYLAKLAGKLMNRDCKLFQMNEYADRQSVNSLIGFEQTYTNSKDGELTEYVAAHHDAILIFDEIEKAHVNAIRAFLPILEGGVLTSRFTRKQVSFRDTIVIFTTNAGRAFYEEKKNMQISAIPEATIIDALRKEKNEDGGQAMPNEILSRMAKGSIIGFDHMNPAKLIPIIKSGMQSGADMLAKKYGLTCTYDMSKLPYMFLYHLGAQLDARVSSERSSSFVLDAIYSISERVGENPEKYLGANGESITNIDIGIDDSEDLARRYLVPPEKKNIILVSYKRHRDLLMESTDRYQRFDAWDTSDANDDGSQSRIQEIMSNHKISAILIDPYFSVKESGRNGEGKMEGVLNLNSRGNNVLRWIFNQKDMPPVYILEIEQHISLVDRFELRRQGVRDVIDFVGKTPEECTRMIDVLSYELFLEKNIDYLNSKGRSIDFSIGQEITENSIKLKLFNYKLVNSMTTDAVDVSISDAEKPEVTFDDVIGAENAKEELRRFIGYLKDPERYLQTGMAVSRGILLYGPAGTGKTKLAKALAAEADCPFIATTGAQFVNGVKNIEKVFRLARKYAPSVVFIDEIDSFALDRQNTDSNRATILNNLLTEMDGFSTDLKKPVFVIAATNAGTKPGLGGNNIYLDRALLRRFSKKVYVDLPGKKERIQFMNLQKRKLADKKFNLNGLDDDMIEEFAKHTAGYSLAEIENTINLALGKASLLEENVTLDILIDVFDESVYGERMKVAEHHIKTIALHEAGHAFLSYKYREKFKPECATLVARGSYLGMVQHESIECGDNLSRAEIYQRIEISLAGRAAELVFNGPEDGLTDGASGDLQNATNLAMYLVSRFGMEEGFLPVISAEQMMSSPLAEKYYNKLNYIIDQQLTRAYAYIKENRDVVERLADELIEKSRLDYADMERIIEGK